MKKRIGLTSVGLLAVALIGLNEALAQDNDKNKRDYPALLDTSDAKGAKVKNLQNEDIGAIDELLIEPPSGRVRFAIPTSAGFWELEALGSRCRGPLSRSPKKATSQTLLPMRAKTSWRKRLG